ncbi:uncharacterized protein LOC114356335 [Ostrinia furnacalis]|uniref:uncharacterized protein LOC114356335 n=1 Tax=Ostrinia furnacalis TaxID=93504 RepID=UPI00103BAA0A|nr:uncharacterized protein LOC114356335 [Ostrinia furnacalis]
MQRVHSSIGSAVQEVFRQIVDSTQDRGGFSSSIPVDGCEYEGHFKPPRGRQPPMPGEAHGPMDPVRRVTRAVSAPEPRRSSITALPGRAHHFQGYLHGIEVYLGVQELQPDQAHWEITKIPNVSIAAL